MEEILHCPNTKLLGYDLASASTRFLSPYGTIGVKSAIAGSDFTLSAVVSSNTRTENVLPGAKSGSTMVVESGTPGFRSNYKQIGSKKRAR